MKRVAVFASGSGSNCQALIDAGRAGELHAEVVLVMSNRSRAQVLERARQARIDAVHLSPKQFDDEAMYAETLADLLERYEVDIICLAGYLKKLPRAIVRAYYGRILNIHPALLPDFGGPGMYGHYVHEAVLEAGRGESGASVHFVTENYDEGPVIAQIKVPVEADDTPESLAARVLKVEHRLYPRVVAALADGKVKMVDNAVVGSLDA